MRRGLTVVAVVGLTVAILAAPSAGRDKPSSTSTLYVKIGPAPQDKDLDGTGSTGAGDPFSKQQIERFRCTSAGDPSASVDLSCNTTTYGQDFAPDNELAIAVDPEDPNHLLAGSNDYFYRFNNATGARQAIVPTGFFTSFDGGRTWVDGQIPLRSGNGGGDPAPAFDAAHDVALMAQLENVGGQGSGIVTQGDVSVSRSTDGGITWSEPITVFKGQGAALGPAANATFWDKEYIAVNNHPGTPGYGRIAVTATAFRLHQGRYLSSGIALSYSDDGGLTWSGPIDISGQHPTCTYQSSGPDDNSCDENQFSYPEFGPDGTLYVQFHNYQNEAVWEVEFDFDGQIMVVAAPPTSGPPQFADPVQVVDLEEGLSDMPFSVISRQTVWGHQLRWNAAGTISADPGDPDRLAIVYADRGSPNPNATEGCFFDLPGDPPDYDPCEAGPGSDLDVYLATSDDGGATWTPRVRYDRGDGAQQWIPWADHLPDGRLAVAWDEDTVAAVGFPPANDAFIHVLRVEGGTRQALLPVTAEGREPAEVIDVSVTHWAGQYVPAERWPAVCGPAGYSDPPVDDAEGKDCNVFHGDYTGLATGSDGSINVVWTGLNRFAVSPQRDVYTGGLHDGYAQDAMFARRF
ncbi:MAG: glycoside hydrolase [Actinomycetota bacterium]|nr:glycoside hydrolase [Actinomycetota bacterium]